MIDYKVEIREESDTIKAVRVAIFSNRILLRDYSAAIGALKAAIRKANREGAGSVVSALTKELNVRRGLVRSAHEVQIENRRDLRNAYIVRSTLIKDWVESEAV